MTEAPDMVWIDEAPLVPPPEVRIAPKIVHGWPPIIEAIAAKFPEAMQPGVLFAWGDTIYNPSGNPIHPALIRHEAVHMMRQGNRVFEWWGEYLHDTRFRFEEEKLAHIAEYRWWRQNRSRHERRAAMTFIAKRLSGPLYGKMISYDQAATLLRKGTQ